MAATRRATRVATRAMAAGAVTNGAVAEGAAVADGILLRLPEEQILAILQSLSMTALGYAACSCSMLKQLSYECATWEKLDRTVLNGPFISLEDYWDASPVFKQLVTTGRLSRLSHLDLHNTQIRNRGVLRKALAAATSLKTFQFTIEWPTDTPGGMCFRTLCQALNTHPKQLETLECCLTDVPDSETHRVHGLLNSCDVRFLRQLHLEVNSDRAGSGPDVPALLASIAKHHHIEALSFEINGFEGSSADVVNGVEALLSHCARLVDVRLLSLDWESVGAGLAAVDWTKAPSTIRALQLGYLPDIPWQKFDRLCKRNAFEELKIGIARSGYPTPEDDFPVDDDKLERFEEQLEELQAKWPTVHVSLDVPF